jgi:hypothetical protein
VIAAGKMLMRHFNIEGPSRRPPARKPGPAPPAAGDPEPPTR